MIVWKAHSAFKNACFRDEGPKRRPPKRLQLRGLHGKTSAFQNNITSVSLQFRVGKSQRVKKQRVKTSENFAEETKMFAEDISEDFSDHFTGIYSIAGYLRNLRGRLLSSEKFSEVFTLWVFTLKSFPTRVGNGPNTVSESTVSNTELSEFFGAD